MLEDYLEILSAEKLDKTKNFTKMQSKAVKLSLGLAIGFITISVFSGTVLYAILMLVILYITNTIFSIFALNLVISFNEIWIRYIIYKTKNTGRLERIHEYVPEIIVQPSKLVIISSSTVLIALSYIAYMNYKFTYGVSDYLIIIIYLLAMFFITLILREIMLPRVIFSRSELFRSQKETYKSHRSMMLAMIFLALLLIYLSYYVSISSNESSRVILLDILYFLSGLILGKAMLTWFRALFSIRQEPLTDPLSFQIVPFLSIIPLYIAFIHFNNWISELNIPSYNMLGDLYYFLLILIYLFFMKGLIGINILSLAGIKKVSDSDDVERGIDDKIFKFWLNRLHRYYGGFAIGILVLLFIGLIITSSGYAILLQSQNEIYYISITSLILGISFGFINYSKNILNYCLENLEYERNRFVKEYEKEEVSSVKGKKLIKEDQKMEGMEDFENILRDLERILQEE